MLRNVVFVPKRNILYQGEILRDKDDISRHFVKTKLFHKFFGTQKHFHKIFEKCRLCMLKAPFGINQFIKGQRRHFFPSFGEIIFC